MSDHMPVAGASQELATAFGFHVSDGFAVEPDRLRDFSAPAVAEAGSIVFYRSAGTLADHTVTTGQPESERIDSIETWTGSAFRIPEGAVSLLTLQHSFVSSASSLRTVIRGRSALELLSMVGLGPDLADRYPHQLSGGQARRVGVARALALRPDLLIADEPTAGLDVSVQGEMLNLLSDLQQEMGLAILIITHNLNIVRHVADRMAIMYLGRFVELGRSEQVFEHPRHPYTAALLAANPSTDPDAVPDRIEMQGEVPGLLRRPPGCEFHTRCPVVQPDCRLTIPSVTGDPTVQAYRCIHPLS